MRTKNSIRNMLVTLIGQILKVGLNFLVRLVFVRTLAQEFLGLEGLFSNILTVLSLAELGVGQAITYSLYEPLKNNNEKKIKSLMNLYKKFYIIIGLIILIVGLSLNPFLVFFIKEMPNVSENINVIYSLYVVSIALSYFASYKRELINADQKMYITNLYIFACLVVMNIFQIIGLIITKKYIIYLIVKIIVILIENILISKKAEKLYPYLKEKETDKLNKLDFDKIKKNILGSVFFKIGKVGVNATDNILISKLIGLESVGLYSNYRLIIVSITNVLTQLLSSVTASVGNLGTQNKKKVYDVFKKIFFGAFWIYALFSLEMLIALNDFISLWLGNKFQLSQYMVLIIVINFFLNGISSIISIFRDAYGLYWKGKYKPIVEVLVNLLFSIILAKYYGLLGILLGTLVSNICVNLWWEVKILYNDVFEDTIFIYFKLLLKNIFIIVIMITIIYPIINLITMNNTYIVFVLKTMVTLLITSIIFLIVYHNSDEFYFYKSLIKQIIKKYKNRKVYYTWTR